MDLSKNIYTQGDEQWHIANYFDGFTGTLCDIGANEGKTFSNSLRLIELGWSAVCVEPSPNAFAKLQELHKDNKNVQCFNYAINDKEGYMPFYECTDALLSALNSLHADNDRWKGVTFDKTEVFCVTYAHLLKDAKVDYFDFITIDAEFKDWDILQQIDLSKTRLICVEYNAVESMKRQMLSYCAQYGLTKLIYQNGENLIIGR